VALRQARDRRAAVGSSRPEDYETPATVRSAGAHPPGGGRAGPASACWPSSRTPRWHPSGRWIKPGPSLGERGGFGARCLQRSVDLQL